MANIEALVLAAGRSSRMGPNKLLLKVKGSTVIEHTVQIVMDSPVSKINVVLGNACSDIQNVLAPYPVNVIYNPNYVSGMSSSLKAGIRAIISRPDIEAVLIVLGDMPMVSSSTLVRLLQEFEKTRNPIIAPRYNGRRGHPVLFSREMFPYLLTAKGDSGARDIISKFSNQVLFADVDDHGIIADLDTKEDLLKYFG